MHLKQKPCYERRSPCQDPAGNRTTRRPPDHRKVTQSAVVMSPGHQVMMMMMMMATSIAHDSIDLNAQCAEGDKRFFLNG